MDQAVQRTLTIVGVIVVILLVWGIIGAVAASDTGVSCNMGIGDSLCWSWEQNTIGDIQEVFQDASSEN